ncbi:hypothetical protein PIB30_071327 [Stylosanthes scabra]|uniref:Transposase n=1 Tax=Stylosanthes scabra TaxID=79078 RepID=A0ABU6QQX8_9FABA|nr:hypothetical protein [Stylosanthes scabra]
MKQQAVKKLLAAEYNKKIKKRDLEKGDLELRRADIGSKNAVQGKLGANWVVEALGKGAYKLSTIEDGNKRRIRAFKKMPKSLGALLESGIQITQRETLKADEPNSAAPPRTDHPGDEMHINIESFAKNEKSSKQEIYMQKSPTERGPRIEY